MAILNIFDSLSSVMTVVSFSTFLGIVLWAYAPSKRGDHEQAAGLPFIDNE
jgi:cytochrome c oxidase cbb3-type subunit 4